MLRCTAHIGICLHRDHDFCSLLSCKVWSLSAFLYCDTTRDRQTDRSIDRSINRWIDQSAITHRVETSFSISVYQNWIVCHWKPKSVRLQSLTVLIIELHPKTTLQHLAHFGPCNNGHFNYSWLQVLHSLHFWSAAQKKEAATNHWHIFSLI